MPAAPERPRHPQDITAEWLTAILRVRGAIRRARVESIHAQRIGIFSSEIWRLYLTYDIDEPDAPASLVLKRPKRSPHERPGTGFANELTFYQKIAPQVQGIRIPCFHWRYVDPSTCDAIILMEDVQGIVPVGWEEGVTTRSIWDQP